MFDTIPPGWGFPPDTDPSNILQEKPLPDHTRKLGKANHLVKPRQDAIMALLVKYPSGMSCSDIAFGLENTLARAPCNAINATLNKMIKSGVLIREHGVGGVFIYKVNS